MNIETSKSEYFGSQNTHISNLHPLGVVGRGSEAQLQMGEHVMR